MHLLMLTRKLSKLCFRAAWFSSSACGLHCQYGKIIRATLDYVAARTARSANKNGRLWRESRGRESRGVKAAAVA